MEPSTSGECRAQAEKKLAQAELDDQNCKRLIVAAGAWLFLAGQLRKVEAGLRTGRSPHQKMFKGSLMSLVLDSLDLWF